MSARTPIFCHPTFCDVLTNQFPGRQILSFSENIADCNRRIDTLDLPQQRQVVVLYRSDSPEIGNQPVVDHINLSNENPLIGPADLSKGVRFPDMSSVYESDGEGIIVVQGDDPQLRSFEEPWESVETGVWEAISLKHRGFKIYAWLIADLHKWVHEQAILN